MKNIHPILKSMIPLVEGVGKTFGKNCEVVLHEIKDSNKSIIAIYNGHVTGRTVGSPMLDVGIQAITQGKKKLIISLTIKTKVQMAKF